MSKYDWSYQVREINNSISLLEGDRKFGTLYGSDSNSEENARLIIAAPEMHSLLATLLWAGELDGITSDRVSKLLDKINYGD